MTTNDVACNCLINDYIIKMTPPQKQRGGAGRGQGRKALQPGEETVPVTVRMTQTQKEKLGRLGGPKWVRAQVDKAKEPEE